MEVVILIVFNDIENDRDDNNNDSNDNFVSESDFNSDNVSFPEKIQVCYIWPEWIYLVLVIFGRSGKT